MRAAASVDRLNLMGEGSTGRKLPSMPDSIQRSPMKISGREGEIAALKRSNRRSASSHNLVNNTDGKQLHLFITNYSALDIIDFFYERGFVGLFVPGCTLVLVSIEKYHFSMGDEFP